MKTKQNMTKKGTYVVPEIRTYEADLPLSLLAPDPRNCRPSEASDDLHGLADSIRRAGGLIEPIIARPRPAWLPADYYPDCPLLIVCGHRRTPASLLAGFETGRVHVWPDLDDRQAAEIQLMENLHRKDISPLDEAVALRRMVDELGYSTDECAAAIARSDQHVRNRLRLLDLPEVAQAKIISGEISVAVANILIQLPEPVCSKVIADCKTSTVQELQSHVRCHCMHSLEWASFDLDANYGQLAPCSACKYRGTHIDLLDEDSNLECPDAPCFDAKTRAARKISDAERKGKQQQQQISVNVNAAKQERKRKLDAAEASAVDAVYITAILDALYFERIENVPALLLRTGGVVDLSAPRVELVALRSGLRIDPVLGSYHTWFDLRNALAPLTAERLPLMTAIVGFCLPDDELKAITTEFGIKVDLSAVRNARAAARKAFVTAEKALEPKRRGKSMKAAEQ